MKYDMKVSTLFTVVACLLLSLNIFAAYPPPLPNGWSDAFVYNNGVRIHYYRAVPASGKPVVVMVHGVTDNGLTWADLSLNLQDAYDVYMLDARGHGLSDPFMPSDDGNTLVKDVAGFIEVMGFEKPILIGHSMGAATVMRVAAEYPNLAKAVIMLDPGLPRKGGKSGTPPAPKKRERSTLEQNQSGDRKISFTMYGDPEVLVNQNNYSFEEFVEKDRRDHPKWSENDVKYWALSKKQYHGPYTEAAWLAMLGTMRTENALAKIGVQSLVLKADSSPENRKLDEEAVATMEKVTLIHVDGAGHNLHHDQLEITTEVIMSFLSDI